ncbi:hypothetical protein B0H14DRAFT_2625386 [Mycena olivaceomarginata]|nr:hypothetical protein B0H14DRAFT_2625386 [Mycena olivaceomarginata]
MSLRDISMTTAIESLERALILSRSCGDTTTQCGILTSIAQIRWTMGDVGISRTHVDEARRLAKLSGNLYQEARALRFAAQCTIQVGDYRNSIDHLHKAKEILVICGMLEGRIDSAIETSRAEVHQLKSEYTEARSIHTHILQHTDHDPIMNVGVLLNIAQIDVMTGATEETVQQNLNEATTLFSTMKNSLGVAYFYLAYGQQYKEKLAVHKPSCFLGDIFIAKGDDNTAKSLFMVALEGFVYMDVHRSKAQCLLRLGDLANKKGDFSQAAELWMAAHPLFERSSQAKDVARIDARLTELEHNQKALMQLAILHPPETIFEEKSSEVQNFNIEEAEVELLPRSARRLEIELGATLGRIVSAEMIRSSPSYLRLPGQLSLASHIELHVGNGLRPGTPTLSGEPWEKPQVP